jgi:hypothetical protein
MKQHSSAPPGGLLTQTSWKDWPLRKFGLALLTSLYLQWLIRKWDGKHSLFRLCSWHSNFPHCMTQSELVVKISPYICASKILCSAFVVNYLDMLISDVLEPGCGTCGESGQPYWWSLLWRRAVQWIGMRGPSRNSKTQRAFLFWMHEDDSVRISEGCWTNPVHWFSITLRGSVQPFSPTAALVHRAFHCFSSDCGHRSDWRCSSPCYICCTDMSMPLSAHSQNLYNRLWAFSWLSLQGINLKKCSLIFWYQNECIRSHNRTSTH